MSCCANQHDLHVGDKLEQMRHHRNKDVSPLAVVLAPNPDYGGARGVETEERVCFISGDGAGAQSAYIDRVIEGTVPTIEGVRVEIGPFAITHRAHLADEQVR